MKISTAILVCSLISITPPLAMGSTIAKWTFESSVPTNAGPYSPEVGSGSASAVGLGTISSPVGNGSAHSFSGNGWNPGDYFQFQLSTVGYQNIGVLWDQVSSGTGPAIFGVFWSVDNGTFTPFGANYTVLDNSSSWDASTAHPAYSFSIDLSSITDLNNGSTAYFRIIDMALTNPTNGAVGTAGTDRIDNFTVSGDKITTSVPDSMPSLAGLGGVLGLMEVMRRITAASNPLARRHA
jgi:hypothetical protein